MKLAPTPQRSVLSKRLPWFIAAAWVLWQIGTRSMALTWGWDESMHAELPAARIALYLRMGDLGGAFDALHSCTQYPFLWPTLLGLVQALTGPSEAVARSMGVILWALTMVGAHALTRSAGARLGMKERELGRASWGAFALCGASPLAAAYAGTLFHAVPSACAVVWALVAWLRGSSESPRADLLTGSAFTLVFFTKFNYGLLLAAALGVAFLLELVWAARAGTTRQMGGRVLRLMTPSLLVCVWWFLLPLPGGAELAAVHREAFLGFLAGNLETEYLSPARRVVEWAAGLHLQPRLLLLVLFGFICALRTISKPGGHLLGAAAIIPAAVLWSHPFHLDRFLIPFAPALWCFAALGFAQWAGSSARSQRAASALLLLCAIPLGGADSRALADAVGLVPASEAQRDYIHGELDRLGRVGTGRRVPTAGLEADAVSGILDACAAVVQPYERIGWLGVSSELSPAALHLGLLERGGELEVFLRDAHRELDVTYFGVDPGWSDERLLEWASSYEVIFMTDPPDLGGRRVREFMRSYQERLLAQGWEPMLLGSFEWPTATGELRSVQLYASRPPK